MAQFAQRHTASATSRLQYNQNLLAPCCVEGSGSANKHDDRKQNKNHNLKQNKTNKTPQITSLFLQPFFFFFFGWRDLLYNSAFSVIKKKSMWNIPLLKLQSGSKPRTFRTHRRCWGMLEYSMDTCHLKKRERRSLNSRICMLPLKHLCRHHLPALYV